MNNAGVNYRVPVFLALKKRLPLHFVGSEDKWYFPKNSIYSSVGISLPCSSNLKFDFKFQFLLIYLIVWCLIRTIILTPILLSLAWWNPGDCSREFLLLPLGFTCPILDSREHHHHQTRPEHNFSLPPRKTPVMMM